jgi:hypothetical protein
MASTNGIQGRYSDQQRSCVFLIEEVQPLVCLILQDVRGAKPFQPYGANDFGDVSVLRQKLPMAKVSGLWRRTSLKRQPMRQLIHLHAGPVLKLLLCRLPTSNVRECHVASQVEPISAFHQKKIFVALWHIARESRKPTSVPSEARIAQEQGGESLQGRFIEIRKTWLTEMVQDIAAITRERLTLLHDLQL